MSPGVSTNLSFKYFRLILRYLEIKKNTFIARKRDRYKKMKNKLLLSALAASSQGSKSQVYWSNNNVEIFVGRGLEPH